jgi:hypothetical protein
MIARINSCILVGGSTVYSILDNIYCLQSKGWLPIDGILNEKKEDTKIIIAWFRKNRKNGCIIDNKDANNNKEKS